jgi:hypothetical protein
MSKTVVPIVSNLYASAYMQLAVQATQEFIAATNPHFGFDMWCNSVGLPKDAPRVGYRTMRLRLKGGWDGQVTVYPTPAQIADWAAKVSGVLAPGFKHYTSQYMEGHLFGPILKGNAFKYHYRGDNQRLWHGFWDKFYKTWHPWYMQQREIRESRQAD